MQLELYLVWGLGLGLLFPGDSNPLDSGHSAFVERVQVLCQVRGQIQAHFLRSS